VEQLAGRVAVVTGAASGIGRALSEKLLGEGMSVVLADVEASTLQAAADALDGDRVAAVVCDVADPASVDDLATATLDRFGAAHLVCLNAGVSGTFGRAWVTSAEEWRWVFDVNVWGGINGIRSFVPILLEQEEGHIVSTGSAACFEALPGMGAYAGSKHAVLGISEALRRELDAAGGRVGVSVFIPGGNISTRILESPRNWPDRFGDAPAVDDDPLPRMIHAGFTQVFAGGADPITTVGAVIDGVRGNRFLISDDETLLATWGEHPAELARGAAPAWPPR
jgi:NAD(P)-dependent dehydrogenase (short-subunit alcohol dehydrogenase family)